MQPRVAASCLAKPSCYWLLPVVVRRYYSLCCPAWQLVSMHCIHWCIDLFSCKSYKCVQLTLLYFTGHRFFEPPYARTIDSTALSSFGRRGRPVPAVSKEQAYCVTSKPMPILQAPPNFRARVSLCIQAYNTVYSLTKRRQQTSSNIKGRMMMIFGKTLPTWFITSATREESQRAGSPYYE